MKRLLTFRMNESLRKLAPIDALELMILAQHHGEALVLGERSAIFIELIISTVTPIARLEGVAGISMKLGSRQEKPVSR